MAVKLTPLDLNFILTQIQMAEAGQPPVNPLLSFGLREVAGTNNNLVPGQSTYGATDQVFPTVTDQLLQGSYASSSGLVIDPQPRLISNLIADQTTANPAAVAAAAHQAGFLGAGYQNTSAPGADGIFGATTAYVSTDAGADGVYGTGDDTVAITGPDGKVTTGQYSTLLHTLSVGADGKQGAATEGVDFKVIGAGADGILGTGDDLIDEAGANGVFDGNVAGSDDIIGTRAQLLHSLTAGKDGILGTADDIVTDDVVSDDILSGNLATPTATSSSSSTIPGLAQSTFINNVTPDNGLSAPANSWFTFFGQFFDHGLDMIDKGGSGTVFIPLTPSDPLYNPNSPNTNFMVLTRATDLPGPDGILGTADDVHQGTNQTSPFVDQSQTYASDPSHQVFLRQYMIGADGKLHSTGALLGHVKADGKDGMATWADLKANAAQFLGIRITDADVGNVPLLATDAYGNFIAGAHGMPQIVVIMRDGSQALIEGDIANPIALDTDAYKAVRTGHAFINDMAQAASPTGVDQFGNPVSLLPDTDTTASPNAGIGQFNADGTAASPARYYDNELLDAHYVAGDGRVNENIGLTAVQDIFHAEHDRMVAQIKATIQAQLDAGDTGFASNWVLPGVVLTAGQKIADNEWNGERLFQAAKFANETEYQHLVFEEFARYVDPAVHVAAGVNVHINAAITSEFANVVYRFGHSMLDENVNMYVLGADGKPVLDANGKPQLTEEGLIQAFTNPLRFASDPNMTADLVLGTVNQVSNAIDEFVTGSLRNNLLGLPLDLAALNIARGRDVGVAPLNLVRNQLYAISGENQLKPYANWAQFGSQLKHPESLVNFIAAYGTHSSILNAKTLADKRAAAEFLIHHGTIGDLFNASSAADVDAYNFMQSQGVWANNKTDPRAIHDGTGAVAQWSTGSITGLDSVDMWIGGLAEKINLFGSQLGSTFEYIFRTQMEALQDGDRLYYLPRIEGMDYEESLQDSSLASLISANTGIKHLPGNIFITPEYTIEASDYFNYNPDGSIAGLKDPTGATWLHSSSGQLLVTVNPDNSLQFLGENNFLGNTIVLGGTDHNDRLIAGAADDDTVYGDGGDDYIDGGGGNDFLFGGDGNDTIIGGQGNDTIVNNAGDVVTEGLGAGTDTVRTALASYALTANVENLTYTGAGTFTGTGNALANTLTGGAGNDTLDGGVNTAGGDTLVGGAGDDTYLVRNAGDVVTEALNAGTDTVRTSLASYTLAANVENLTYTGAGTFTGTGNALANSITGGAGADTLSDGGAGGSDTLTGLGGNDTYVVTNAGDAIVEAVGGGTDTVSTSLNTYSLAGAANVENLTFTGTGAFTGTGNALANTITGGAGNDTLDGGVNTTGGDTLVGGIGSDTYIVRNAADVVTEGAGLTGDVDTVNAFINTYTLASNVENLTFLGTGSFTGTGNAGNNVITGGAGADTLNGGGGSDTLIGGAGADTLTGGAGVDAFFLAKGDANGDLITDFNKGTDQILLSGYAAGAVLAKTVTGTATTPTSYAVQVGGVTVDTFKLTGAITLAVNTDYRFV